MNEFEAIAHIASKFHVAIYILIGYFVFSNAVGALPSPDDKASVLYRYLFAFFHGLAGNLKYAISKIAPTLVKPE